jgi:hypothetical protein
MNRACGLTADKGGNMSQHEGDPPKKQLPHLVFGGELVSLDGTQFRDLSQLDIVGIYPNYATAYTAWKSKAQQTVDNAHMRYFIVHLHRLLDPEADAGRRQD